jgi:hypothetical protein
MTFPHRRIIGAVMALVAVAGFERGVLLLSLVQRC